MEKFCSKCEELKEISCFGKKKSSRDGHMGVCKACTKVYQKEWHLKNEEDVKEKGKKYNEDHKDERNKYYKEYNEKNREKKKEQSRIYDESHREQRRAYAKQSRLTRKKELKECRENNKDRINETARNRTRAYSNNTKKSSLIRSRILNASKKGGVKKCGSSQELLGCSWEFFDEYIESLFTKDMTWENRGRYGWHYDHIIPCDSFDMEDPEQQKLCFHYTNIQPLWATTKIAMKHGEGSDYIGNIEKGNRIL